MKVALAIFLSICVSLSVALVVVTSQNTVATVASQGAALESPLLDALLAIPLGTSLDDCEKNIAWHTGDNYAARSN